MSEQPHEHTSPVTDEPLDPQDQPAAGGSDEGEAAQGDGAADSH